MQAQNQPLESHRRRRGRYPVALATRTIVLAFPNHLRSSPSARPRAAVKWRVGVQRRRRADSSETVLPTCGRYERDEHEQVGKDE